MRRLKYLIVIALAATAVGCTSVPKKELIVAQKVDMKGRDILTVVMTHLEKKKEIAAFNAVILSEIGSPKIVPKVPEGVDTYVEEALREAMANRTAPVLKDLLDVFTEALSFDTLLLVRTEAADVTDSFIGIPLHTYPDSMKVTATLFDAKEGGLIGAITSPVRVMDKDSRIVDIGSGGQSVIAELLKKVKLDAPKKAEESGGSSKDLKALVKACKKEDDGAACRKLGDLYMKKGESPDSREKAAALYRRGCDLKDKASCKKYDALSEEPEETNDEDEEDI